MQTASKPMGLVARICDSVDRYLKERERRKEIQQIRAGYNWAMSELKSGSMKPSDMMDRYGIGNGGTCINKLSSFDDGVELAIFELDRDGIVPDDREYGR